MGSGNAATTPGNFGSTTAIPVITVNAQGQITTVTEAAISTSFTLTGDSGSNQTVAGGDTLDIAGGTGISSVVGATDTVTLNLDNTAVSAGSYGSATAIPT